MKVLAGDSPEVASINSHIVQLGTLASRAAESSSRQGRRLGALCARIAAASPKVLKKVMRALKDAPAEDQVLDLSALDQSIGEILYFLTDAYESHLRVVEKAHEIVYLADWFFELVGRGDAEYVVAERNSIATTSFSDYAYGAGLPVQCPELWACLKDEHLDLVFVPPGLAALDAARQWAVVLHELGHVLCDRMRVLDAVPELSPHQRYPDLRTEQKSPDPSVKDSAQQKLHAIEYLADMIATLAVGPGYPWCLLTFFASRAHSLFPGPAHPPMPLRMGLQAWLVGKQGFEDDKNDILDRIVQNHKMFLEDPTKDAEELREELDDVQAVIEASLPGFRNLVKQAYSLIKPACTAADMLSLLQMGRRGGGGAGGVAGRLAGELATHREKRREEFLQGKPFAVEPSAMFYMLLPLDLEEAARRHLPGRPTDEAVREQAGRYGELLADCFKLHYVKARVS